MTSTPNAAEGSLCGGGAEFVSRHSAEGRFTFADQRAAQVVGHAPQDLLGKLAYEFYHPEDQQHMRDNFDQGDPLAPILFKFTFEDQGLDFFIASLSTNSYLDYRLKVGNFFE